MWVPFGTGETRGAYTRRAPTKGCPYAGGDERMVNNDVGTDKGEAAPSG